MKKLNHLSFFSAITVLLLLCFGSFANAQTLSKQQILDNWATSIGGRERIDKIVGLHTTSEIHMFGMEGTMHVLSLNAGTFKLEMELGGIFSITQLLSEGKSWAKDQNDHLAEVTGHEHAGLLTNAFFENYAHLRTGAKLSWITKVRNEKQTGYVAVTLTPPNGIPTVFFLDPGTWLPVRSESSGGGGDTMVVSYSDWQKRDGILIPHQIKQSTGDPTNDLNLKVTSVEINPNWKGNPFAPLKEAEVSSAVIDAQAAKSIPMKLGGVHIYVDVMVNGSGPYTFVFDTGAGITVIDEGLAKELNLQIQGEMAAGGVGDSKAQIKLATGVNLGMPGVLVPDQTIATLDIQNLLEGRIGSRIDGILGYGFISRFVTKIDYANQRISFFDPASFKYHGKGEIVPLEMDGSTPHIQATICGYGEKPVTGHFMLDSGSGGAVSLAGPFAERVSIQNSMPKTVVHTGGFGVGGESTSVKGRLQSLQIGSLTFKEPVAGISKDKGGAGADEFGAGLIGGRILSRCRVYFDYTGKRLILEPNETFAAPFTWNNSGLTIATGGRGNFHNFTVSHVIPGSPGEAAGLMKGDQLLHVDGRSAKEWTNNSLSDFFRREARDVEIIILRNGVKAEVTLNLKEMF